MTDQTLHNLKVVKLVAYELETDKVPSHLFCNVHPSLMFNHMITGQWEDIENTISRNKFYPSFFGFGECDLESENMLSSKHQEKREHAPINNIKSEGEVGLVNYELLRRQRKQTPGGCVLLGGEGI